MSDEAAPDSPLSCDPVKMAKHQNEERGALNSRNLREKLKDHEVVLGCAVGIAHPIAVEAAGYAGFDFVFLDTEHSALGVSAIEAMILAARATGVAAIYRLRHLDGAAIGRALDIGADGILVPHVKSAQQAREVVEAARYAPLGKRGLGPERAIRFGLSDPVEYMARANDETVVAIMIEDREAVENIEAIAAVEGIDVFNIGTWDLSYSFGIPLQTRHPKIMEAIARVIEAAKANGIVVGVPPAGPEEVAELVKLGCRFFESCSAQGVLVQGLRDIVQKSIYA